MWVCNDRSVPMYAWGCTQTEEKLVCAYAMAREYQCTDRVVLKLMQIKMWMAIADEFS